jgi:hypothetical protein
VGEGRPQDVVLVDKDALGWMAAEKGKPAEPRRGGWENAGALDGIVREGPGNPDPEI